MTLCSYSLFDYLLLFVFLMMVKTHWKRKNDGSLISSQQVVEQQLVYLYLYLCAFSSQMCASVPLFIFETDIFLLPGGPVAKGWQISQNATLHIGTKRVVYVIEN